MKKPVSIILATLMLLVLCGPALAGSDEIITVGPVQITRGELDRLKAMVAGEPVPSAEAPAAAPRVDLGVVELPQAEFDMLKAMIAGTYVAPETVAAGPEMVDAGMVVMPRAEFESLKRRVSDHLQEVHALVARTNLP